MPSSSAVLSGNPTSALIERRPVVSASPNPVAPMNPPPPGGLNRMTTNVFTTSGAWCYWPDVPLMFSFVDLDGNRFSVSEHALRGRR
jgi:hypothetical protein